MKTIDQHFADWESEALGYGYGTGEKHTIEALSRFLNAVPTRQQGSYDYRFLELKLTPTVAWLLINILCKNNIIEYGSSTRFGWLTPQGAELRKYVVGKDTEDLVKVLENTEEGYIRCYMDHCNCSDGPCMNPFWGRRK